MQKPKGTKGVGTVLETGDRPTWKSLVHEGVDGIQVLRLARSFDSIARHAGGAVHRRLPWHLRFERDPSKLFEKVGGRREWNPFSKGDRDLTVAVPGHESSLPRCSCSRAQGPTGDG